MIPGSPEYRKMVEEIEAFNKKSLSRVFGTTGPLPPKLPKTDEPLGAPKRPVVTGDSLLMRAQQFAANVAEYRGGDSIELLKLEAKSLRDAIYNYRTARDGE